MPAPLQTGTLLVASQDLQDPHFARAVVLLIHHDKDEGTMGLILNRPMGERVQLYSAEELRRFAAYGPDGTSIGQLFFEGGPVERSWLFYLHRLDPIIRGGTEIVEGLFLGGDLDAMRAEAEVAAADEPLLRFYLGYAGWDEGQLEYEIELGAWILAPGDAGLVFSTDPEDMWHDALYSLGGKYRALAELPVDPSVN